MTIRVTQKSPKNDTQGGREESPVVDDDARQLLGKILKELKVMNLHLATMSEEKITYEDL